MIRFGGDAESRGRSALADVADSSGSYRDATQQLEAGMTVDRGLGNLFAAQKKQITLLSISLEQARTRVFAQPKNCSSLAAGGGTDFAGRHLLCAGQEAFRTGAAQSWPDGCSLEESSRTNLAVIPRDTGSSS